MKKFAVLLGIVIAVSLECRPGMAREHGVAQYHAIRVAMNSTLPRAERAPARPQGQGDSRAPAGGINTSDYVIAHLMTIGQYRSDESGAGPAAAKRNADG
ncbi:MAG TPA: hypothetical protein VN667_20155 [Burkholderiales bacterium]|nr:hypothetical protein [Burkholderiales bacterium]